MLWTLVLHQGRDVSNKDISVFVKKQKEKLWITDTILKQYHLFDALTEMGKSQ